MRIAIATPAYPLPDDPTRGRYIYEIARCLGMLADVEVFFHTARYPKSKWLRPRTYVPVDVTSDLSSPGVSVRAFDYPSFPVIARLVNGAVSGRALLPRLASFRPDVILGYWIYPEGYGAWRCATRLKVPCVLGGLGTDIRGCTGVTRWYTKRALCGADRLIMVSQEMRTRVIEDFHIAPGKVRTITNGINSEIFRPQLRAPARAGLGLPAAAEVIVYVGRFVATKGLRELLEAFAVLAQRRPDARLALLGHGVMLDELRERISAAPWGSRVDMPGALQPEAVAEWIAAANLLCLPSYSEGHPNVVVEALACGRPVVATDVGGTSELVDSSNGRLVPPRDAKALCDALDDVLNGEWDHAQIAAGCSRSWMDVARATLDVCEDACARSSI